MGAQKLAVFFALFICPFVSMANMDSHMKREFLDVIGIETHDKTLKADETRQRDNAYDLQRGVANDMADMEAQVSIMKGRYGNTAVFKESADPKTPAKKATPANPLPSEMNYADIFKNPELSNVFFDKWENEKGNSNTVQGIPEECKNFTEKNSNGITYVQPSNVNELGAVLFNGQSCSGVKRSVGKLNNWPSSAVNGKARMTPNGAGSKNSDNFTQGDYGPFPPIWLGESGSVQIHSLNRLEGNKSLAGVSSMGCLVVNQDCMQAINAFVANQTNLSFSIIPSSTANTACTQAVNKAQSI